jgi:hypothetical protein
MLLVLRVYLQQLKGSNVFETCLRKFDDAFASGSQGFDQAFRDQMVLAGFCSP